MMSCSPTTNNAWTPQARAVSSACAHRVRGGAGVLTWTRRKHALRRPGSVQHHAARFTRRWPTCASSSSAARADRIDAGRDRPLRLVRPPPAPLAARPAGSKGGSTAVGGRAVSDCDFSHRAAPTSSTCAGGRPGCWSWPSDDDAAAVVLVAAVLLDRARHWSCSRRARSCTWRPDVCARGSRSPRTVDIGGLRHPGLVRGRHRWPGERTGRGRADRRVAATARSGYPPPITSAAKTAAAGYNRPPATIDARRAHHATAARPAVAGPAVRPDRGSGNAADTGSASVCAAARPVAPARPPVAPVATNAVAPAAARAGFVDGRPRWAQRRAPRPGRPRHADCASPRPRWAGRPDRAG